ncbi:CPCC family cysteine-rich protein [Actinoplanes regularis]|uniref:Cysteine-rich CPCC n=1 Tax=Actinoplanes regularis TaxID=52697 RepID=A0A238YE95_9ACTN|nr:CPCC family cysteine-rich protein [Actinoplanes regularis]GIE85966.1 hypothetical protein Are01nite_24460 [Actinoplanes regularis]SNR69282.1 Cysteine-rich CPCC [Actinoplanes regularis]
MDVPYACVCCGYLTLSGPPGSHEICAVCGWEDDVHQLRWPYRSGGANESSLIEAQRSFAASGSGREADVADFDRAPFWRPIEAGRDRFEPRGGSLALWPEDRTVMYWWRRRSGKAWWEEVTPVAPRFDGQDGATAAAFVDAVSAVAAMAQPADPDNLSGMEIDFDHYLWRCPSIRRVTVESSPEPARQLTARCLAEQAASPHRVATEIKDAWLRELRYSYWEAHLLRVNATSVELDVATQVEANGYFITGTIIVKWSDSADAAVVRA